MIYARELQQEHEVQETADSSAFSAFLIFIGCSTSNVNEYKNHTIKEIINQRKVKLKQESLRLLYVAMTRAEDELYIFGESGNKKDSWYSIAKTILADNFVKYFE